MVEGTGCGTFPPVAKGEGMRAGQGGVHKPGDGVGIAQVEGTGGGCTIPPAPPGMCAEGEGMQAGQGEACKLGAGVA